MVHDYLIWSRLDKDSEREETEHGPGYGTMVIMQLSDSYDFSIASSYEQTKDPGHPRAS
jgi:hypothetical protein